MIIKKLQDNIKNKSCVCVGLDTSLNYLPDEMRTGSVCDDLFRFNKEIIDCTKDLVAVYKLQIAYYEAAGIEGLKAYKKTLEYIKSLDLLSIGDIKRGDIAATAKEYAHAHLKGDFAADFITLNPYMGYDSITPYLPVIEEEDKGLFILLRTSNPGAKDIEYLQVEQQHLYYHIGDHLQEMGKEFDDNGMPRIGMVVGGTHSDEAKEIRDRYPNTIFLIPGYGAQGGKAEDIRIYLGESRDKGVVNSSRGIITAHQKNNSPFVEFQNVIRNAVVKMVEDIHG